MLESNLRSKRTLLSQSLITPSYSFHLFRLSPVRSNSQYRRTGLDGSRDAPLWSVFLQFIQTFNVEIIGSMHAPGMAITAKTDLPRYPRFNSPRSTPFPWQSASTTRPVGAALLLASCRGHDKSCCTSSRCPLDCQLLSLAEMDSIKVPCCSFCVFYSPMFPASP